MSLKYVDEYRDPVLARTLLAKIEVAFPGGEPVRIMEVCGTHTMAIARYGIRTLLKGKVTLLSGPGCPVCVTPDGYIDAAIELGRRGITLCTFGDMVKVPGSQTSLERERGNGVDVRIVYSPMDAVALAEAEPGREVVFLGVGFETTTPTIAGTMIVAKAKGLMNFSVLSSVRTIPEAMEILAGDPEVRVQAYLCPAHVSAIIGADAYKPLADKCKVPCVVGGFEPVDILAAVEMILRQKKEGRAEVENEYSRVVSADGNPKAKGITAQVYEKSDAAWRGIGILPSSGLSVRESFADYDAERKYGVTVRLTGAKTACRCGDVLKGKISPSQCPLFGTACDPEHPIGPCMVSTEGTCSAHFKYGVDEQ